MELVNCDLCGYNSPSHMLQRKDRFSDERFSYVRCSKCGLIYLENRPTQDEISKYYPREYEAFLSPSGLSRVQDWHIKRSLNRQLRYVHQFMKPPGRLLDVGCATGQFLEVAREHKWMVYGIEMDKDVVSSAVLEKNLDIWNGTFDTFPMNDDLYNVITFWDVLEHLPSLSMAFRKANRLLVPGGIVIFSIPNLKCFDRMLFGRNWIGWDAPRHFYLPSIKDIVHYLGNTGFKFINAKCSTGAKGSFLLSLETIFPSLRHSVLFRFFPLINITLLPYRYISYWLNRAPVITFAASKSQDV